MTARPLAYDSVQAALTAVGAAVDAAEAQGVLCGMLAARTDVDPAQWMARVLDGTEPRGQGAREVLEQLSLTYEDARSGLDDPDLRFHLLLPDDEQPLPRRAEALGAWCDGFLFGLGSGEAPPETLTAGEAAEALEGLSEIARVDSDAAQGSDEDAYAELVEFVRVAALMVREQVQPKLRRTPVPVPGNDGDDRLH